MLGMGLRQYVVKRERGYGWIVWDRIHCGPVAATYRLERHARRAAIHLEQIAAGTRRLVRLEDDRYALRTPTGLRVSRRSPLSDG